MMYQNRDTVPLPVRRIEPVERTQLEEEIRQKNVQIAKLKKQIQDACSENKENSSLTIYKNAKPMSALKREEKRKRKRKIEQVFSSWSKGLYTDIKRVRVDLTFDDESHLSFCPRDDTDSASKVKKNAASLDTVQKVLCIQDRYRLSDEALHELHMLNAIIPSKNVLQDEKKRLSGTIAIQEYDGVAKEWKSRIHVSFEYDESDDEGEESHLLDMAGLQELWKEFHRLMEAIRALPHTRNYLSPDDFQAKAREWGTAFRKLTFDEDFSPYMHTMVYHVPQFLDKYRYIHDIGVSQVERKNFDQRTAYFDCTNRCGGKNRKRVSLQIGRNLLDVKKCLTDRYQYRSEQMAFRTECHWLFGAGATLWTPKRFD